MEMLTQVMPEIFVLFLCTLSRYDMIPSQAILSEE